MKNNIFSTRGFSPMLILILLFIILSKSQSPAYWHRVYNYDDDDNGTVVRNVTGDSSALYASVFLMSNRMRIVKSTNQSKTWKTIYNYKDDIYSNYRYFTGMRHPASGYMYLLFSDYNTYTNISACTGIKRFDERIGKVVDSIVIELRIGKTKHRDFFMFDSLNGLIYSSGILSVTRNGWKSFTQTDVRNRGYNKDSSGYVGLYYGVTAPLMLSIDTVFSLGSHLIDRTQPSGFHLTFIGKGDTTFTFEPLGYGINIEITKDSTHFLTSSSEIYYKRPGNFAYINDSTWLYTAAGRNTGYGSCKTLEILKTTNRGKSYYQVCDMSIRRFGVHRIFFKDSLNGIATGNGVTLLTDDCGETWTVDTTVYDFDWTILKEPFWNLRVSYVDNMTFLTCFSSGMYKYETVVGVKENSIFKNTLLYPNPIQAGKILNFKIPQLIYGNAFIYDIYGNKVDELNFFGNSIQLRNDIVAGTYFLVIGDMNEKIIMRSKFIVK